MSKFVKIDDKFCMHIKAQLDTLDADFSNKIPFAEKGEILKLVAGLQLVYHMASGEEFPHRNAGKLLQNLRPAVCGCDLKENYALLRTLQTRYGALPF